MSLFQTHLEASRQQLTAHVGLLTTFGQTSFQALERLTQLNLAAARASIKEVSQQGQNLFAAGGPQEAGDLLKAQTGASVSKVVAYANHVAAITSEAQGELVRAAEAHVAQSSQRASNLVDELAKTAPAGSENVFAFVKSSIGNAQNGFEQANRNARRAADEIESQVNEATKQFVEPVAK